jgi:demethylmenaquinone methyltransferase/2-methoxy-6-polyprenyl-1,4-benzoquinol methylase
MSEPWALALFRKSVLKQRKLAEIERALGPTSGRRLLDLGSDNGVVSLLLRRRGGSWASADLTEESVNSIRELVGEDVHRVDGRVLPFADAAFDGVVVVDMLEHVPDEAAFLAELARVTRPGGRLVVCEFSHPTAEPFRRVYLSYLMRSLPAVARSVSSNPDAYVYLAESIRAWPDQAGLATLIGAAGWQGVAWRNLTGGIVALHRATRG